MMKKPRTIRFSDLVPPDSTLSGEEIASAEARPREKRRPGRPRTRAPTKAERFVLVQTREWLAEGRSYAEIGVLLGVDPDLIRNLDLDLS